MAAVRPLVHSASAAGWISEADEEKILKRLHSHPVTGWREGQSGQGKRTVRWKDGLEPSDPVG
jgi:hypothetical protein